MTKREKMAIMVAQLSRIAGHLLVMILVFMILALLGAPLFLIFSEGPDGTITVWNFVGIAYALVLIYLIKRWIDWIERKGENRWNGTVGETDGREKPDGKTDGRGEMGTVGETDGREKEGK